MKKGYDPTHPFTIFESLIPGKLYIDWKCRSTDFEVRKLWKGQSGRGQRRCTIPAHSSSGNGRRSCERRSDSFLITFFSAFSCFLIFFFFSSLLLLLLLSSSFSIFFYFSSSSPFISPSSIDDCHSFFSRDRKLRVERFQIVTTICKEKRGQEKNVQRNWARNFWNMFFLPFPWVSGSLSFLFISSS